MEPVSRGRRSEEGGVAPSTAVPAAAPGVGGAAESVSERSCQGRRGTTPLPPITPAGVPHQPNLTPPRTPGPPGRAAGKGGPQDSSPRGAEAGRE